MRISQLLSIENKKHKRRFNFMLFVALIGLQVMYLWFSCGDPKTLTARELSQGWKSIFINIVLLNAIFLPTVIAILASRFMDIEHKGDTFKSLYTFARPQSVFLSKVLYGIIYIFAFMLFQMALIMCLCGFYKFPDVLPISLIVYYFFSTMLICIVLYLIQLILSYFVSNQALSVCIGFGGSFVGLFSMYFPPSLFQRIVPWGLYSIMNFIIMDWNKKTRVTTFYLSQPDMKVFLYCALWLCVLCALSVFLLDRCGTEQGSQSNRSIKSSPVRMHKMPVEIIKLKGSPAWIAFIVLPALSAFIGTLNYLGNLELLKNGWSDLWTQHTLFLAYFFMPVTIAVFCGVIWRVEHTGCNMNQLLVNQSPASIILQKYACSVFITWLSLLWIGALYIFCGYISNISGALPVFKLAEWIIYGCVGAAAICSFQILLSLIIRNFVIPIGIAFVGGFVGLGLIAKGHPYISPYSLFSIALSEKCDFDINRLMIMCIFFIIIALSSAIIYMKRSDVRSHE